MNLLAFIFLPLLGLILVVTSGPPGYASVGGNNSGNNNTYSTLTLTPNMIAAGGPISPN
jgi:hypothetical protein